MFIGNVKSVIEQISKDKGIEVSSLISTIEEATKSAAKKTLGQDVEIEVYYDQESGEIEVFQFKTVVDEVENNDLELTIKEGQKLDENCKVGDSLGFKIDIEDFGRIAAQSAKQVIIQKMKNAEKDVVYKSFINRKGENVNGIVQQIENNNIIINLGTTEAILPFREQIPKDKYRRGDRIKAYIFDVLEDTRGPQVILSRIHPNFLINLFAVEVPEINEGIVKIVSAAREAGSRAKIAVTSSDADVDPVGSCVGIKGSRVQNVVRELKGEKIDIITWFPSPAKYVCNALAPAEISKVIIDESNNFIEVVVSDEFLSIAIGKGGQNVRLASKLTNWKIDVQNEEFYEKTFKENYNSLLKLTDDNKEIADILDENGYISTDEIKVADAEELSQIEGITIEMAKEFIKKASTITKKQEQKSEEIETKEE